MALLKEQANPTVEVLTVTLIKIIIIALAVILSLLFFGRFLF